MEAVVGAIGVGLMLFAVGMSVWYASFYGDDALADRFASIEAPTGFLSFLEFVGDFAVAVSRAAIDIMTFDAHDMPEVVQTTLRVVFGLVFGIGLLMVIISAL